MRSPAKGLLLHIYRDVSQDAEYGESSNGGISSKHDRVVVVGTKKSGEMVRWLDRSLQVVSPSDEAPAVVLVQSSSPNYGPHLEPLEYIEGEPLPGLMMGPTWGGCYAGSADSRWAQLGSLFDKGRLDAVPLHDRMVDARDYDKEGFLPS